MTKRALITGISGQDGSYLSEYLLSLGYEVHGILRRHSVAENQDARIRELEVVTHYGNIKDNSYNGIVSSGTFTHGHVGPEVLFEIKRILSKGGVAVLSVNSKHWHSLGFDATLQTLEASGSKTNVTEVNIYGQKCEADSKNDTAYYECPNKNAKYLKRKFLLIGIIKLEVI